MNNKLSRIFRGLFQILKGEKSLIDNIFLKNQTLTGIFDTISGNEYTKSDLVYICITTTARAISQVPLIVQEKQEEGFAPVGESHPLQKIFNRPNPYMDMYSFIESIISYLLLDGDAFIIPFPDIFKPEALYVVRKNYITPIRDNETNQLIKWSYRPGREGKKEDFEPTELVHIWLWNPNDPVMGLSPLQAGRISINQDYKAAIYNTMFFDNSANPSGVLSTDRSLTDTQFTRLKEQIEDRHKGYQKSHKLLLLEQGLKYTQTSLTHKDMEFLDLRRFNTERILQVFGMKKAIISVTEDLNYATAREQRKEWWQDTNLPLMRLVTSALNFSLLFIADNLNITFDISSIEALHEDFSDKVDTALKLWKMGFTANEINKRLELGFEEKPWRDKWWGLQSLQPLSDLTDGEEVELPEEPEEELLLQARPEEELPGDVLLLPDKTRRDDDSWEARAEKQWKSINRKAATIESRFESKIKRAFFEMRKKALALLYDSKRVKSPQDFITLDFTEEMRIIEEAAADAYEEAVLIGGDSVAKEVGMQISFEINDPVAVSYLQTKLLKIVGVGDTIKRQLNQKLSEGMSQGESIDQLAKRVKDVFNAATKRARTIARTEVVGSTNFGRYEAIKRTGFRKKKWFTALDEKVRRGKLYDHAEMHGRETGVNELWVTRGGSLRYPGDYLGAPGNIINCRCIEVVVTSSLSTGPVADAPLEEVENLRNSNKILRAMSPNRVKGFVRKCYMS